MTGPDSTSAMVTALVRLRGALQHLRESSALLPHLHHLHEEEGVVRAAPERGGQPVARAHLLARPEHVLRDRRAS